MTNSNNLIYIETYGCSANLNNAEIMKGLLLSHGFTVVETESLADIIILNTCVVKEPTIKKIEDRIKGIIEKNKKLVITGCMPEVLEKKLNKLCPRASLIGVNHIKEIPSAIKKLIEGEQVKILEKNNEIKLCTPKTRQKNVVGITQIAQGCLGSCAYCYTRVAKGTLFSYPEDKILKNIEQDIAAGCKEIWLTSQDNASYGLDVNDKSLGSQRCAMSFEAPNQQTQKLAHAPKSRLPLLINSITSLPHRFFLRIGMMNPENVLLILDELIESYKDEKVFKFLHISLQSGSDKILKSMNRKYKAKDFLEIVNRFTEAFPDITISTDIIVGFPGETDEDFQDTLDIIKKIKPDVLNISRFWPMEKTEAKKMSNQISPEIKRKRATELMNLHAKIALENKKPLIGQEYKVIVDENGFQDTWIARNEFYKMIILRSKENIQGKFLKVRIKEAKPHYLLGEVI
jgi:threonylcarbamoyladenosine tRNA methylthiotransferase CDKAL1